MSNDISSMYTKDRNIRTGRKGYGQWKHEKEDAIRPADYGNYVLEKREVRRNVVNRVCCGAYYMAWFLH